MKTLTPGAHGALLALVLIVAIGPAASAGSSSDLVPTTTTLALARTSVYRDVEDFPNLTVTVSPTPDSGQLRIRVWRGTVGETYQWDITDNLPANGVFTTEVPIDGEAGIVWYDAVYVGSSYFEPSTSGKHRFTFKQRATWVSATLESAGVEESVAGLLHVTAGSDSDLSARGVLTVLADGDPLLTHRTFQPHDGAAYDLRLPRGVHQITAQLDPDREELQSSTSPTQILTVGDPGAPVGAIEIDASHETTSDQIANVSIGPFLADPGMGTLRLLNSSDAACPEAGAAYDAGNAVTPAGAVVWDLSTGDGDKHVCAEITYEGDAPFVLGDSIWLDTVAPVGTFVVNDDDATLGYPWPHTPSWIDDQHLHFRVSDLALDHGGTIDRVGISGDGSAWVYQPVRPADPTDFQLTFDIMSWTELGDIVGPTTYYVKWRDSAGNWSEVATDSIDIIQQARAVDLKVDGELTPEDSADGVAFTQNDTIQLQVLMLYPAHPDDPIERLMIGTHSYSWPTSLTKTWSLVSSANGYTSADGVKSIDIRFVLESGDSVLLHRVVILDRIVPTSAAPAAAFSLDAIVDAVGTASGDAEQTVRAKVAWSGKDNRKLGRFVLQQRTGSADWKSMALPKKTATSTQKTMATALDYRFRVRAIDSAGNAGAWKTGVRLSPELVPDNDSSITYRGAWTTVSRSDALGGSLQATSDQGASVSFGFTGAGIAWVAPKSATGDSVAVWIDGKFVKLVHLNLPGYHPRRVVFSTAWVASGHHTIKLVKKYDDPSHVLPLDGFLVLAPA